MNEVNSKICLCESNIAAYIDGELELDVELEFERHIGACAVCAEKLNEQKRLLCTLELVLGDEKNVQIPADFARKITVRAESTVSGLRLTEERRRAVAITFGLFLSSLVLGLIGGNSGLIFLSIQKIFTKIWAVCSLIANFCYDFAVGLLVILRAVFRLAQVDTPFVELPLVVLLVVSLAALSHLLFKYRRV